MKICVPRSDIYHIPAILSIITAFSIMLRQENSPFVEIPVDAEPVVRSPLDCAALQLWIVAFAAVTAPGGIWIYRRLTRKTTALVYQAGS